MVEAPGKIKEVFEELKMSYGEHIELKFLNKRFCIFEATSKWDSKRQKPVKITHYIGWITDNGVVVPAKPKNSEARLKALEFEYNKMLKHQKELEEKRKSASERPMEEAFGNEDILLLQALSMNSRLPHAKLSKITGIPIHALEYRISRLEKILSIKYTLELNMNNLGFSEYMVLARFISSKPSHEDVKKALSSFPRVQLALVTKGNYDLIIFYEAENNTILSLDLDSIRNSSALSKIDSEWYVTPIATDYGFVPLRQEFFEVLKEKVWHRKKHGEKPNANSLMQREYALLRELNQDSAKSFASIERGYNLPEGSPKRAYSDLCNEDGKNIIIRPTLLATSLNKKYDGIIIANINNKEKFITSRDNHRRYIINESGSVISKFSYICDMETPDGIFYLFPVLKEDDMERIEHELSNTIKGVKFDSLIVESAIMGDICYRKFDNLYSDQYASLVKRKSIPAQTRTLYS
jgi:DNA-binding Lrp family transcriptional regulator